MVKLLFANLLLGFFLFGNMSAFALVRGKTATEVAKISGELYGKPDLWKKTIALRSVNSVNITSPTNYKKHLNLTNLTRLSLIKSTLNGGNAKYFGDLQTIQNLEKTAFNFGVKMTGTTDTSGKIFYKSKDIMGASKGRETKYMRIDYSGGQYHGHPVFDGNDGLTKEILLKLGK